MFLDFFYLLKSEGIPVSLKEYLTLLEALDKEIVTNSVEDFYFLSRSILVKNENQLDRFDQLFGFHFKKIDQLPDDFLSKIPENWLRKNLECFLSEEDKKMIEAFGGMEKLMERFKKLMKEQKERHEGGNKWIGTGGTSPFGAYGYNPQGFRIGQEESRHRKAIKVWDKREFANLDDSLELDTRNIKIAIKRLRAFTREGIPDELDLADTIKKTSENGGYLDLKLVPSKKNRVKVLLLMDVGGSMDDHIALCSKLFSAARHEFKHLEFYYFHNCLYESVWKDNNRRHINRIPTFELLNKYNNDYKIIFVGDAAMSPYEILYEGGSVEHNNQESGTMWMKRFTEKYAHLAWINPNPEEYWNGYESTQIIKQLINNKMFPLTVEGITKTMKSLL